MATRSRVPWRSRRHLEQRWRLDSISVPSCAPPCKRIFFVSRLRLYNCRLDLSTPLANSSKSNRRYPRIPTPKGVWVSWQHDGAQSVSRVRDLNVGGLFIDTKTPPPVGASLSLLFSVPEGEIRSSAIVRNVTPGEGMGVQFMVMSQEHAVRLQTLFTRLLRSSNATPA
jgi:PilZ domain